MANTDLDALGATDDDVRQRYPLIARPAPAQQPVSVRGLTPPASAEPTAPTIAAPKSSPTGPDLAAPTPAIPTATGLAKQTNDDRATQAQLSKGSGISQIGNPWARGALRGLNIAGEIGSAVVPELRPILGSIPGTEEHHQKLLGENTAALTADQDQADKEAQASEAGARTNLANAQATEVPSVIAKNEAEANPKVGATPEETTLHDLMTGGENGQPRVNPETQKPYTYLEAYTAVKQSAQDTKPDKDVKTDKVDRIVNGKTHTILIDAVTGKDIRDEGEKKLPGESPDQKRSASEIAQVEREARQNIRKAEGQYRDTQKSVGQLTASIDAAKDGNGLLTSFVPTMEVLGINASNGVHRISPAEAEAANLPGGFIERFNAWFDKAATGKTSPELVKEGKQLAGILLKSSHDRYKATYDDEKGIAEGYGAKDFSKHIPLLAGDEGGGGNAPAVGTIVDGYKYNGGDPSDKKNWEQVKK